MAKLSSNGEFGRAKISYDLLLPCGNGIFLDIRMNCIFDFQVAQVIQKNLTAVSSQQRFTSVSIWTQATICNVTKQIL